MTFRPSDDVIIDGDSNLESSQSSILNDNAFDDLSKSDNRQIFHSADDDDLNNVLGGSSSMDLVNESMQTDDDSILSGDLSEAPDLSQLLGNSTDSDDSIDGDNNGGEQLDLDDILSETAKKKNMQPDLQNELASSGDVMQSADLSFKMSDEERYSIVSKVSGSIHGKIDLFVDDQWYKTVELYRKIHRIVFKRGILIAVTLVGVFTGTMLQVKASDGNYKGMVSSENISDLSNRRTETPGHALSELGDKGVGLAIYISQGSALVRGKSFLSRSNLMEYKGIILPQLVSLNYEADLMSASDFYEGKVTREDLEKLIKYLITNDTIYKRTSALSSPEDLKWTSLRIEGGLISGFNLGCLKTAKVSDFVCDKYLANFYSYGKYYNLLAYDSELQEIVSELIKQKRDVEPVCQMILTYTWHGGESSDTLTSIMNNCHDSEIQYYKALLNFIRLDQSLKNPVLSEVVYEDKDLNAYKLLSSWQIVYKILDGTTTNDNYISSYLDYVQTLINKDAGTDRYLDSLYKDLLYVFNMDVLYNKLLQKGEGSSVKVKIDQINNGNLAYGYRGLVAGLVTPDIVKTEDFQEGNIGVGVSFDDVFMQYYSNEKLKIRKKEMISEDEARVQTEIFSDTILSYTDNETLKATIQLYRKDNVLYVRDIRITNQDKLTDILNIYAKNEEVSFYAMLGYIEEQVGFRYESAAGDKYEEKPSFCEEMQDREDIEVYNCSDTSLVLYKSDVEYNFTILDGKLTNFVVGDADIDGIIREKLDKVMITKDNTQSVIKSIVDYNIESPEDDHIEAKLQIVDQFRINLKLVPTNIYDIEGEDSVFLVEFTLGDFDLQARYNVETHLLTRISYVACDKILEIRGLSIEVSVNNVSQLNEIMNNPRVFFTLANQAAYKKYQTMCEDQK